MRPPEGRREAGRPVGTNGAHRRARARTWSNWLNGVKVVEYELWSPEWRAQGRREQVRRNGRSTALAHRGHIALQGDHDGAVAYRAIRIRELP